MVTCTLLACGDASLTDPETGLVPAEGAYPSVVVGNLGWDDVTTLGAATEVRERTRAVGFLALPEAGHWCTATLVAPDAVLTAAACVRDADGLRGASLAFRRETGIPQAEWAEFRCDRLLAVDTEVGFTLIGCDRRPGEQFGVADVASGRHLAAETDVYLVQQACDPFVEPRCRPTKRVSKGTVLDGGDVRFLHEADALEGALGGPIFAERGHQLVGLHVGGNSDGESNRAISGTRVRDRLESLLPQLELGQSPSVFGAPPLPPDPFEPNQEAETATRVKAGFQSDETWVDRDDLDVYVIWLEPDQILRVKLTFMHELGDIDLAVYGERLDGAKLASGVSATDDESVRLHADQGRVYHVVVYGYQGASNAYSIAVDVE